MTDDEWELKRNRAILAAFQTGRPVFADSDGEMRYVDGDGEPLPAEVGVPMEKLPRAALALRRAARASYWAAVTAAVASIGNAILGVWRSWHFVAAIILALTSVLWFRVRRRQLEMVGDRRRRGPQ